MPIDTDNPRRRPGRPRLHGERTVTVKASVPLSLAQRLEKAAAAQGVSVSSLVLEGIRLRLGRYQ